MSEHQTIIYEAAIVNKRMEAAFTKEIEASPGTIFPLICPVEELRWIPDWNFQLIYSRSGVNEPNCIFTEEKSGMHFFEKPLTTTWVTILHDPDNYCILFHLNLAGKAYIGLSIRLREVGKNVSSCTWNMVFTALDEEANAMPDEDIRIKLELALAFIAEALKHYCETGELVAGTLV